MAEHSGSLSQTLARLEKLKTTFTPAASRERLRLISNLSRAGGHAPIRSPKQLETYHDILSFVRAYPDSPALLAVAEKELRRFSGQIDAYRSAGRDKKAAQLDDSGIINTSVSNTFSYEMACFLSRHYPSQVEIDWDAIEDAGVDNISAILGQMVSWQENDTLDNDDLLETKDWLMMGRFGKNRSGLQVLLSLLNNPAIPYSLRKHLYESAEVTVRWQLTNCKASRTLLRLKSGRTFFQTEPAIPRTRNLSADLSKTAIPLRKLSSREGATYVRAICEVLASRVRELYPLTNSNPDEVYIAEPGRSVQIVIFGTLPRVRLPLEGNFGALLVRNGIPIGYGVAAVLFERVEIAINVFPAFRTGESSFVIEHFFRLFHHNFSSRLLLVRAYQVGDDNDEALESGSFWFYYKLGFRPVKAKVRTLAEREAKKVASIPGYRSSLRTLKQLARSDVFFHVNESHMNRCSELSIINLGLMVTRLAAKRYNGNRFLMETDSQRRLLQIMGNPSLTRWSDDERIALNRLSPLLMSIPDIHKWSRSEKTALIEIIRAKGSICEKRFVMLSQRHPRLAGALSALAKRSGRK